jgi:pilus assembly protein Flp/PilA
MAFRILRHPFVRDVFGTTAIEYGLILALIVVGIIGLQSMIGTKLINIFTTVTSSL